MHSRFQRVVRATGPALFAAAFATSSIGCASTSDPKLSHASDVERINWRRWNDDAFNAAKADRRLIVIDVGIEGCTACRWMDEDTYANPEVVALIESSFVAIQVDAEARPDLGERYSNWAWPATIFLTPDGEQVLALRGNKRPRNFLPILRTLLDKQRAGTLDDDFAAVLPPPSPASGAFVAIRDRVAAQLDRSFIPGRGWNRKIMHTLPERLEHAFVRARIRDNGEHLANALAVADRRSSLLDGEWGGIFVAGLGDVPANEIIPEKRTRHQAGAMEAFASAYQLTGETVWRDRALNIDQYMRGMMLDDDGTFFTTQEDDAPKLPPNIDARAYYRLTGDERRAFGVPPIDHATYSDRNGAVIRAYLSLYRATGERSFLDVAVRTATTIVHTRQQTEGWIAQTPSAARVGDQRMRALPTTPRLFLRSQAQVGLAFVSLAESTRDPLWLDHATRIAKALDAIEDDSGGFFASTTDSGSTSAKSAKGRSVAGVSKQLKPLEDNAAAALFLFRLGHARQDPNLLARAERTLRAVTSVEQVKAEGKAIGQTATALELVVAGPVHFVVVTTNPTAPDVQALWDASLRVYEPRRVLRVEAPGHYPDRGRAALYICTDNACSSPIVDAASVTAEANRFAMPVGEN